jgi:hypothetical protein
VSVYRKANLGRLLPDSPRTSSWPHLVADLVSVLRKLKPSVVVVPHPWLDTHLDHEFVTVALVDALAQVASRATFLLYTNHASADRFPFGPAGSAMSLPPWAGPLLPVQRVLSVPTGSELLRRKLFALESMHDLRLAPGEQPTCGAGMPPAEDSRATGAGYFRRALRSEETFFVYDPEGLKQLVAAFLAKRPKQLR